MSKNKSVHVITKYYLPVTAGIEVNISQTYQKLAKRDWDITIHTSKDTLTEKNCLKDSETIENINVKRYTFDKFGYWPQIDWDNADYVCLHNFNVFPHLQILLFTLWKKLTGKKKYSLFLTPHGGFTPEWRVFKQPTAFIKRLYHFTVGTLLINNAVDGVRAVSVWERNEIISNGVKPDKVVVIDNGIEDEAYLDLEAEASEDIKERVKNFGKYIIQIGRVYPIKNYETVINAMTKVDKDVKFLIVGPIELNAFANYKNELNQLIKKNNLEDRVIFTGVIKGADKFYLIKHAQMMVHMALWESFCNVVHEGLSQGLVCVVANNTALPYLIKDGENGYCIETLDHNKVAEKINYVLHNKQSDSIKEMEERNRIYGLKNSWKDVSDRMYKFYGLTADNKLNEFSY